MYHAGVISGIKQLKRKFVISQVDCGSTPEPVALEKIEQGTHTLEHWR